MSLQFIMGRSGSGKTTYFIESLTRKTTCNKIFYVVPEPMVICMQKKIMESIKKDALINIEVVSFEKLVYRVFESIGFYTTQKLDKIDKLLLIIKILFENKEKMKFIKDEINDASSTLMIVNNFIKNNVTIENMESVLDKMSKFESAASEKIIDLKLIYQEYIKKTDNLCNIPEQNINLIIDKIKQSDLVKNCVIYIDEFYEFTQFQISVVKQLLLNSNHVYISGLYSEKSNLFVGIVKNIQELKLFCGLNEIRVDEEVFLKTNLRYLSNKDMQMLEENIINTKMNNYTGEVDHIKCISADNIYGEVQNLRDNIIRLLNRGNIKYDDIAIVYTSESLYKDMVIKVLDGLAVPACYTNSNEIGSHSLVRLILGIYNNIQKDFSYESLMSYLNCGYIASDNSIVFNLDKYITKCGICGYDNLATTNFEYNFVSIKNLDDPKIVDYNEKMIYDLNEFRKEVMKPYITLKSRLVGNAKHTVAEYTGWLYEFINTLEITNKLEECDVHIWNHIINVFEKLLQNIGDMKISIDDYQILLLKIIESVKLDDSKCVTDGIVVESIEKLSILEKKVILILGANDGRLVKVNLNNRIMGLDDIQQLGNTGLRIDGTYESELAKSQIHMYSQLTKAKEEIYISYTKKDKEGKSLNPDMVINKIKRILKGLKVEDYEELLSLERDVGMKTEYNVSKDKIALVCGGKIKLSASKLQDYAMCPFKYFVKYNLGISEKEVYELKKLDVGKLYHWVMCEFFCELVQKNIDIGGIEEGYIYSLIEKLVEKYILENEIFAANARYRFITKSLTSILNKSTKAIVAHISCGRFTPTYFEMNFKPNDTLSPIVLESKEKAKLIITGTIDRVDVLNDNGKTYIKLIDYKSGNMNFNIDDVYNNINLQLPIYLMAIKQDKKVFANKNIIPAGVFYFKIGDKKIRLGDGEEEKQDKKYKMSGLVLADKDVAKSMDINLEDGSNIVPVGIKKDGEFTKASSIATEDEFDGLVETVKDNIIKMADEILDGNIELRPYKDGQIKACDYCEYKSICGFVPNKTGRYRKKQVMQT